MGMIKPLNYSIVVLLKRFFTKDYKRGAKMIERFTLDNIISEFSCYANIERLLKNIECTGINKEKYNEIWIYPKNLYNCINDRVNEKEIHFYFINNGNFYDLYFNKEDSYKVNMSCIKLNQIKRFNVEQNIDKNDITLSIIFKDDKIVTMSKNSESTGFRITEMYIDSIKEIIKKLS